MSLFIVVAVAIAAFAAGYRLHRRRAARERELLAWFKDTFLRKQGWIIGLGNYELQSFDGGKRWYAVEPGREDGAVRILGPADEVHPGLLAQIDGMDRLVKHVRANGPLTLAGPSVGTDLALLESAGFTVIQPERH